MRCLVVTAVVPGGGGGCYISRGGKFLIRRIRGWGLLQELYRGPELPAILPSACTSLQGGSISFMTTNIAVCGRDSRVEHVVHRRHLFNLATSTWGYGQMTICLYRRLRPTSSIKPRRSRSLCGSPMRVWVTASPAYFVPRVGALCALRRDKWSVDAQQQQQNSIRAYGIGRCCSSIPG